MSEFKSFVEGRGKGQRSAHAPAAGTGGKFPTQATAGFVDPHYPFQPLPPPNGQPPYRYNLAEFLDAADLHLIKSTGTMVFHTVGDTGDYRGRQQDFVAALMTRDADILPANKKPAFFYHLGDVVYFAGDIDMYGANFYETYKDYPSFIVSVPGNHDCQPDDPQDGPVNPGKVPLDGWVQNFMSKTPSLLGSLKTGSNRTQMDLPNVYWTFNTPFATIIGLFSNVGETEGEIHQDQIDWFRGELKAADPSLALIVTVHHPPFSGDIEHSGSSAVSTVLFDSFKATGVYPNLILSGHVHNYQRFTYTVSSHKHKIAVPCIVAGNGGYTNLSTLHKIDGKYPTVPLKATDELTLEQYDQSNFGFLRLEVTKSAISGSYFSAPYAVSGTPEGKLLDSFAIDITAKTIKTL
jgi:acid phosphatase type 7